MTTIILQLYLQTPAVQDMFLPIELAPLVFQFLPVETLERFPQNDPLLITVLKIQDGCRPFRVTYQCYAKILRPPSVRHMGCNLKEAFSEEVLLSLGVVHKVIFTKDVPDTFASLFCKNDKADDSCFFPRTEEVAITCLYWESAKIDLSIFPNLRKLYLNFVAIEMNWSQGFIKLDGDCVDWKPSFDKSWCRSMELNLMIYSVDNVASLQGFSNLKILEFVEASIDLSQGWLPNLPLERLSFRDCDIDGTEFGLWPLVEKLEFRLCEMEPLKGHFPQLESLILDDCGGSWCTINAAGESDPNHERLISVPIPKENLKNVKSFSLSTEAKRFDLSSFKKLNNLEVWDSYQLTCLDGLNVDTLERAMVESCPILKMDFPSHVSVKASNVSPDLQGFPESECV